MFKYVAYSFIFSLIILFGCQTLESLQVETIVPAQIEFPGSFNKVVFLNFENDLNNDHKIDTLLYSIITKEMNNGFLDAIQGSTGIDTADLLFVSGFPDKNKLYKLDTISWNYLERLSGNTNADIFIVLDSMSLSLESDVITDYYISPVEYYKYQEVSVDAHWSVFDLIARKRLDQYNYTDTFLWDALGYSGLEVEGKIPSVEKSIRETSYFTAFDYGNRIFPGWQSEIRYYFISGNNDFRLAATFVKNNRWDEAVKIWMKYIDDVDRELASRAYYNLALASELEGNLDMAISRAQKSNKIKPKSRTRNYIAILIMRKQQLDKLQKQIY